MFGLKHLETTPTKHTQSPREIITPLIPHLSAETDSEMGETIRVLKSYVKLHGADVKTWFRDFDIHHNGNLFY